MRAPLQKPTTYDIEQEQQRHDDAIHWFGEMSCFISWWRPEDFDLGLVGRCTDCYIPLGDIADAYRQAGQDKCPTCFGTSFEGGIKTLLYRPALWDLTPRSESQVKRGDVTIVNATIEMLSNVDMHQADVVVRADGTRWRINQPVWQEITTGFGSQKGSKPLRLGGKVQAVLEDPSTVNYFPAVSLEALNLDGWLPYVPHSPHPLDQEGPPPVVDPGDGTAGLYPLRVQRTRLFEFTTRFWLDPARTLPQPVSGRTYRCDIRTGIAGTLIATMNVDMTGAASGAVRFWVSGVVTTAIVQDAVWIDILEDLGSENVTVMEPHQILVVDVVTV